MAGAGGVVMSIADGARWLTAHLSPPEWFKPIVTMTSTPRVSLGPDQIGLGWCSRTSGNTRVTWHNGGTGGFTSFAAFDRARHIGIVAFAASAHTTDFDRAAILALEQCADEWRVKR